MLTSHADHPAIVNPSDLLIRRVGHQTIRDLTLYLWNGTAVLRQILVLFQLREDISLQGDDLLSVVRSEEE